MSSKQNDKSKRLRQKMINLMYLIFIVLAFLYIPTDFIDTIRDINKSLEPSKKQERDLRAFGLEVLKTAEKVDTLGTNEALNEYTKFLSITDGVYASIDSLQQQLLALSKGVNKYGFINKPSEFQVSEKFFIEKRNGIRLRSILNNYKDELRALPTYIGDSAFTALINTDSIIVNSLGKPKKWEQFYFKKTPIGVSMTILSKFKNDVSTISDLTINEFIKKVTEKYELGLKAKKPVQVAVEKKAEKEQEATPLPPTVQSYPSLDKKEPEALYLGIRNPLRIYHPRYKPRDMYAEITNGEINNNDSMFYATPTSNGPVEIRVYNKGANNTKGSTLIVKKRFIAKELPTPKAFLADRLNGSISAKILSNQIGLDLKYDDLRSSDSYIIKQYTLIKVSKANGMQTSSNTSGASFNSSTRQLIDEAKSGDMYIFDNIKVSGPNGVVSNIPSLVLSVN